MSSKEKSKIYKWGMLAGIAAFSIFLFYINLLFPYLPGDDFIFQLKIPSDGIIGTEKISSLGDLIESQVNFYNNYHYRVLNHTVLQVLLLFPQWIFDLLNTIVFLLLPWVILKTDPSKNKAQYLHKYCLLLFFIWTFHFSLGWSYFPATGALNYTWMLIPQLLYIALLLRHRKEALSQTYPLIILAGINCMANENVCLTLLALTLFVAFETRARKSKTLWICLAIIIAGGVFMLMSPSIAKRLASQGHREAGALNHLLEYLKRTVYYLFRYSPVLFLLFVLKGKDIIFKSKQWLLLGGLLVSTLVMAIVPLYESRSAVFPFFLLLLFVASQLGEMKIRRPVILVMMVLGLLVSLIRYPSYKAQYVRNAINKEILESSRGQSFAQLEKFCDFSLRGYQLCHEISLDPKYVDNQALSKFYNIGEVKLADEYNDLIQGQEFYQRLRESSLTLSSFDKIELSVNHTIYFKRGNRGVEVLVESSEDDKTFYIMRGHQKGITPHLFYSLLPESLRLYFLDYLEDTTEQKQASQTIGGKQYMYRLIPLLDNYDYILLSEYDFEKHSSVGQIVRIEL